MKCGGKEWEGKECVKQGCGEEKQEREKRSQRPTYKWRSKKKKKRVWLKGDIVLKEKEK